MKHGRAVGLAATFSLLAGACGGESAPEPKTAAKGGGDAAEECLHGANVKRAKPKDPGPIGLDHILVRHRDIKGVDDSITRSRGEACLRALEALKKLQAGAEWDTVVGEYSDERGAASRGGALGTVTEDMLDREFAAAAYELELDQISYVVETKRGFHVIHRLE
jgi:hypothetical protein